MLEYDLVECTKVSLIGFSAYIFVKNHRYCYGPFHSPHPIEYLGCNNWTERERKSESGWERKRVVSEREREKAVLT